VDNPGELAQRRFRELLQALGEERQHAHGWKKAVAEEVGISPSHLSRVLAGERDVSQRVLSGAAQRYKFSEAYYSSQEGHYREFPPPEVLGFTLFELGASRREAMVRLTGEVLTTWMERRNVDPVAATTLARLLADHPATQAARQILIAKSDQERARLAVHMAIELEELLLGEDSDEPT